MHQLDRYQFIRMLASSPVGTVWSGLDDRGLPVTVAQFDATLAGDPRWREAFTNAAATARYEQPSAGEAASDFAAPTPFVAWPNAVGIGPAARIFQLLGVELTATPATEEGAPSESAPAGRTPQPAAGPQQDPGPGGGGSPAPTSGAPASGVPGSGPPPSVSAPPYAVTMPFSELPPSMVRPVQPAPDDADVSNPGVPRITPSPPRQRRTGLWIGIGALVLVLLAGGGSLLALNGLGGTPSAPAATSAGDATALPTAEVVTGQPASPGAEPPKEGTWPAAWSRFQENDDVQTLTELEGISFPVKVPQNWQCTVSGLTQTSARYYCGLGAAGKSSIGGELIVRECPMDCPQEQQAAMRKAEEAWGLQWVRSGRYSCYAESSSLDIDGEQRYGLVVVAYWRGDTAGKINRQVVFRMTAPVDGANQLRRVANYLRDTLIF
ncbi:hypothetical protein ABZ671_05275 [Micromonospora sp. NPDC006766]|uniref:hypothetical protein n=1 Tax=Micromonospora sp. NPDC006766 TaxID=3154778 RepID=UPI0033CB0378